MDTFSVTQTEDLMNKRVESGVDFLRRLETDVAIIIFKCLDDPADLVRASLVSRYWHNFVVSNELSKQLCVAMFPQLSNIEHVAEIDYECLNASLWQSIKSPGGDILCREHKVYASLLQDLRNLPSVPIDCIWVPYNASSNFNCRVESLINACGDQGFSAADLDWSSKGQKDPNVPESLIYGLKSDLCVISEIRIQHFEVFFKLGNPIYSAKSVRFRMGYPKNPNEMQRNLPCSCELADDKFIWTYTSEEFPMSQENRLQHCKFKEPVVCIGGYLEVLLSGRVQRKETDGLFYTCVLLVKVMGQPLSPQFFQAGAFDPSGKLTLVKTTFSDLYPSL